MPLNQNSAALGHSRSPSYTVSLGQYCALLESKNVSENFAAMSFVEHAHLLQTSVRKTDELLAVNAVVPEDNLIACQLAQP